MPRYLFAGILLSLLVGCHQQPREVDGYLEALFDQGLLNGNVLIARGDSILYQRSFGFADPTEERPLTIGHHFAIGSIQKEFPAAAIILLVEEGLVELEAPIAEYLPELPAWSRQVTIRHLLQYSSGLPEVDWKKWFGRSVPPDQETILDSLVHGPALLFPPGTDYSYTHYSPFLLQRIVERITALPFPVFLEEEFFYPHGMEGISVMEHYPYRDTARMALPFDEQGKVDDLRYQLTTVCVTTTGLYQWIRKLDSFTLLTPASVRSLSAEARSGDNVQAALGRADWSDEDLLLHLHHGSSHNFEALVQHRKVEDLTIVILTNRKNGNLHEIADSLRRMVYATQA